MFRSNPAFQLAMALLVVFYAYVLQVSNSPYLCIPEAPRVLEEHERKAKSGSHLHARLNTVLREVRRKVNGRSNKGKVMMNDRGAAPRQFNRAEEIKFDGWLATLVNTNRFVHCVCVLLAGASDNSPRVVVQRGNGIVGLRRACELGWPHV